MIKLTIQVAEIGVTILTYDTIRLYRSDSENGTYAFLASVNLLPSISTYTYIDSLGTPDKWYKSSFYSTSSLIESSLSDAARGTCTLYNNVSYPVECGFGTSELTVIRKIRRLIGDYKGLERIFIEGPDVCADSSCSSILADGYTIDLGQKGWPVYISIDGLEYITLEDPIVKGYRYLTFSGSLITLTNDCEGNVDIWYNTFKFSDIEIYEAYGDAMIPPLVPISCVTDDHLILQAAIDLLESMAAEDIVDSGASVKDDMTSYDPSPGLREINNLINRLRKQLDLLTKECLKSAMLGLEGVLVD